MCEEALEQFMSPVFRTDGKLSNDLDEAALIGEQQVTEWLQLRSLLCALQGHGGSVPPVSTHAVVDSDHKISSNSGTIHMPVQAIRIYTLPLPSDRCILEPCVRIEYSVLQHMYSATV